MRPAEDPVILRNFRIANVGMPRHRQLFQQEEAVVVAVVSPPAPLEIAAFVDEVSGNTAPGERA